MKKVSIASFLSGFLILFSFSQDGEHTDGARFLKRVENNLLMSYGVYNLDSKGEVEKLFFGDYNARVEFFHYPSFEGTSGFRVVRDSLDTSWILELKYVSNYNEAHREASKKKLVMSNPLSIPEEVRDLIREHNRDRIKLFNKELYRLFRVETLYFAISDQFADNLYQKMIWHIDNFKAKGLPQVAFDGYSVTFRSVVDDEVWSLWIHMPQGISLIIADLCREIITEAKANKLDERKYITVLNTIETR